MSHPTVTTRLRTCGWNPSHYRLLLEKLTLQILEDVPLENSGRRPDIYATAALYASDLILAETSGKKHILTQKLLGKILNMGDYSVREHYCLYLKEYAAQRITVTEPHIASFCKV